MSIKGNLIDDKKNLKSGSFLTDNSITTNGTGFIVRWMCPKGETTFKVNVDCISPTLSNFPYIVPHCLYFTYSQYGEATLNFTYEGDVYLINKWLLFWCELSETSHFQWNKVMWLPHMTPTLSNVFTCNPQKSVLFFLMDGLINN